MIIGILGSNQSKASLSKENKTKQKNRLSGNRKRNWNTKRKKISLRKYTFYRSFMFTFLFSSLWIEQCDAVTAGLVWNLSGRVLHVQGTQNLPFKVGLLLQGTKFLIPLFKSLLTEKSKISKIIRVLGGSCRCCTFQNQIHSWFIPGLLVLQRVKLGILVSNCHTFCTVMIIKWCLDYNKQMSFSYLRNYWHSAGNSILPPPPAPSWYGIIDRE